MIGALSQIQAKYHSWESLGAKVRNWREQLQKVVFTNGCFDLLHKGHIHYLSAAADYGDRLVIGINSDESVRRIKGADRPIQDEEARAIILASLLMTDAIVLFNDDDPDKLIRQITPDVLVKGGDYTPEQVIGADHVWAKGGKVHCVPFMEGYSTTNLANYLSNW